MDKRFYFILGDLLVNSLTGALVGLVCNLLIDTGWNMWIAMFVAMAIGMGMALVLFFPAGMLFGAMEVMVPQMQSGMWAGMVVGMWAAMHPLDNIAALEVGALCGLAVIIIIWALNSLMRGPQKVGEG